MLVQKSLCTACGACYSICSQKAIFMKLDKNGFEFPEIDIKKCVGCGQCEKICPIRNIEEHKQTKKIAYAAFYKNENTRLQSSSGGVFSALAEAILTNNGVVFGAIFTTKYSIKHAYIDSIDSLHELRGSKYVQSSIGDSLIIMKSFLDQGRQVLFVGTPCQIAGVRNFLKKEYDTLFLVDIVCHGVPSPLVWGMYLQQIMLKHGSIKQISFRNKQFGWKNYSLELNFESGVKILDYASENPYMLGFLNGLFMRESCYKCKFRDCKRYGDLTIADCWGIENIVPKEFSFKGISLVLINNEKGKHFLKSAEVNLWLKTMDFDFVQKHNRAMIGATYRHNHRDQFFDSLVNHNGLSIDLLIKNQLKLNLQEKIYRRIWGYVDDMINLYKRKL